jgi:hypothetical protein
MQRFLRQTLEKYFQEEELLNEQIFAELSLYIYSLDSKENDLYMLAQLLEPDQLQKLISYYDGDILKLPSREAYKNSVLTALCFWLKEFKGYTWNDIKLYLNLPENHQDIVSSISLGYKINKVKDKLGDDLLKLLEQSEDKDFKDFYDQIKNKHLENHDE